MVSGGKEGVLVIWQLENQQKNFLPRVGGSIKHLFQSNDGQHIGFAIDSNGKQLFENASNVIFSQLISFNINHIYDVCNNVSNKEQLIILQPE